MAIAYKSSGAGAGTETSGAALNLACPATVDANDILIAHVMHTGTTTAPSTPSGWSLLYGPANVGTTATARHWCFGKLADGSEDGASISFGTAGGTNGRAGRIYSFSGYAAGSLADVVPAASFSDIPHATDPQGPSVTTTVAGAVAVALMCQDDNNTPPAITGMSGGTWAENAEYVNATWGPQGIQMSINTCTPTADPGTVSGGAQVATNDEAGTIGFEIRPEVPSISGTGSLTAQSSGADGAGASASLSTDGAIAAQVATLGGAGLSTSLGTGALAAQAAAVTGSGLVENPSISGSGALAAQAADVTGAGLSASLSTDGAVAAQVAAVAGSGAGSSSGSGAPANQAAQVAGAGQSVSVGSGALAAQAADITGVGYAGSDAVTGTGSPAAQAATVSGTGYVGTTTPAIVLPQVALFIPRRPRQRLKGQADSRRKKARVRSVGRTKKRRGGRLFTLQRRPTVSARARHIFRAASTTWRRRSTLAVTARQDLTAWTVRRAREDDELLLLLKILDQHEPSAL